MNAGGEHVCVLVPEGYCAHCRQPLPVLPWTTAEQLFFDAGAEAVAGWPLPSGSLPVHACGRVHEMTREEWDRYRALVESRRALEAALVSEAALAATGPSGRIERGPGRTAPAAA